MRALLPSVALLVALVGCAESVNGGACPYGTTSGASRTNSSTTCKPRPAPGPRERVAVRDGSAWRAARAAFARSSDAAATLSGIGLNAWGETTFTLDDDRLVTYDRRGRRAPGDVPDRRRYARLTTGFPTSVKLADVPAAGLTRVLARVARAAPDVRFETAQFAKAVSGRDRRWTLAYAGMVVFAEADGSGMCAFEGTARRGLPRCGAADLLPGASPATLPDVPAPATDPRLACVQAAGTDVVELQKCAK